MLMLKKPVICLISKKLKTIIGKFNQTDYVICERPLIEDCPFYWSMVLEN